MGSVDKVFQECLAQGLEVAIENKNSIWHIEVCKGIEGFKHCVYYESGEMLSDLLDDVCGFLDTRRGGFTGCCVRPRGESLSFRG